MSQEARGNGFLLFIASAISASTYGSWLIIFIPGSCILAQAIQYSLGNVFSIMCAFGCLLYVEQICFYEGIFLASDTWSKTFYCCLHGFHLSTYVRYGLKIDNISLYWRDIVFHTCLVCLFAVQLSYLSSGWILPIYALVFGCYMTLYETKRPPEHYVNWMLVVLPMLSFLLHYLVIFDGQRTTVMMEFVLLVSMQYIVYTSSTRRCTNKLLRAYAVLACISLGLLLLCFKTNTLFFVLKYPALVSTFAFEVTLFALIICLLQSSLSQWILKAPVSILTWVLIGTHVFLMGQLYLVFRNLIKASLWNYLAGVTSLVAVATVVGIGYAKRIDSIELLVPFLGLFFCCLHIFCIYAFYQLAFPAVILIADIGVSLLCADWLETIETASHLTTWIVSSLCILAPSLTMGELFFLFDLTITPRNGLHRALWGPPTSPRYIPSLSTFCGAFMTISGFNMGPAWLNLVHFNPTASITTRVWICFAVVFGHFYTALLLHWDEVIVPAFALWSRGRQITFPVFFVALLMVLLSIFRPSSSSSSSSPGNHYTKAQALSVAQPVLCIACLPLITSLSHPLNTAWAWIFSGVLIPSTAYLALASPSIALQSATNSPRIAKIATPHIFGRTTFVSFIILSISNLIFPISSTTTLSLVVIVASVLAINRFILSLDHNNTRDLDCFFSAPSTDITSLLIIAHTVIGQVAATVALASLINPVESTLRGCLIALCCFLFTQFMSFVTLRRFNHQIQSIFFERRVAFFVNFSTCCTFLYLLWLLLNHEIIIFLPLLLLGLRGKCIRGYCRLFVPHTVFVLISFILSVTHVSSIPELALITTFLPLHGFYILLLLSEQIDLSVHLTSWLPFVVKAALVMMPLCALCPVVCPTSSLAVTLLEVSTFFNCAFFIAYCDI